MTPTTKTAVRHASTSPLETIDATEHEFHERNRILRERYIEVERLAELPGSDDVKCARQLKSIGGDFIKLNSLFAEYIVSKIAKPGDDRGDLYAKALETMWIHFLKWDPAQARFTTYAHRFMLGDVGRERAAARNEGSYGDHRARAAVLTALTNIRESEKRNPTLAELVAETGLTADTVRRVLRPVSTSVDRKVGDDSDATTVGELIPAAASSPIDNIEDLWLARLKTALSQLNPLERKIVVRRRGLDGWPGETLQQVSKWLGIGREPVRRAELSAMAKLEAAGTPLPNAE